MAIRLHLEALNMGEEEFALVKKDRLMADLLSLQSEMKKSFLEKIENMETVPSSEIKDYLDVVEKLSGEIDTAAGWLGYGREESDDQDSMSFKMIEAKVSRKALGERKKLLDSGNEVEVGQQVKYSVGESEEVQQEATEQYQEPGNSNPINKSAGQLLKVKNGENSDEQEDHSQGQIYSGQSIYPIQPTVS